MKARLAANLASAALAALVLSLADSAALHLIRPGVFASAATSIQFWLVTLGAALSLFLPAAFLLALAGAAADRVRNQGPALAAAAMALAFCVFALNQRFAGNKVWFLATLTAAAAVFGALLRLAAVRCRGRKRPSRLLACGLGGLSAILFALDATQLPGLYSTQHVTVGILTWLCLHTAFLALIFPHPVLLPAAKLPRLSVLLSVIVLSLSLLLFWVTPGDAIGESLRWAANSGSTATREVLHLLAAGTDLDHDGHASLLGRGDCRPFDSTVHPGAPEVAGDGIDGNCLGGDPSPASVDALHQHLATPRGPLGRSWRNVLLLSVDALRRDRVFGPLAVPGLSALAATGVVLEKTWCIYPGTVPSLYGMVTSHPPSSFELTEYQSFEFPSTDRSPTLFEIAEAAGIRTGAAVFHGSLAPRFGITRGAGQVWAPGTSGEGISSAATTAEALRMLGELKEERFLLWIHYFDPHAPYDVEPDSPLRQADDTARYDAEIERVSRELPKLFAALEEHGLARDTAVVFFSDHGEEFREHQGVFHGQALYEESVRIPLVFLLPGIPSYSVQTPTSLLDLAPTTLELLGLQDRTPASFSGCSLGALLSGPDSKGNPHANGPAELDPVFPEVFQKGHTRIAQSVILWPWKLIRRVDDDAFELYHLEADPGELRNVFDPSPGEAAALQKLLDAHLAIRN